jgi:hypothetical protein
MLDKIVRDFRDEDRHTIIGMAIVASAGREARETLVWTLVGRWGVMWPPGKDEYGKVIPSEYGRFPSVFFWVDWGGAGRRLLTGLRYRLDSTFLDPVTPRCAVSKPAFGFFPPDARM